MEFKTALSCGDKAWTFDGERIRQRTVGQVRVEYTQSHGLPEGGFMEGGVIANGGENYAPMEPALVESYMCVETGIGSGSVYTLGETIFVSEEACRTANATRLADLAKEKRKREDYQREQRILRLRMLRHEISSLKRQHGMEA
jgi:hypothetical protein